MSPLYLYGRQQDLALQRARNTILQRNHLRLFMELSGRGTTSPENVEFLDWHKSSDPIGRLQADSAAADGN